MANIIAGSSLALSLVAALFGLRAATVTVHDDMDRFIADLHKQGRWAGAAAAAAAIATMLQIIGQITL